MIGGTSKNSEPGRIDSRTLEAAEKLRERQRLMASSTVTTESYLGLALLMEILRIPIIYLSLSHTHTPRFTDLTDRLAEGDENTKVGYIAVPLNS